MSRVKILVLLVLTVQSSIGAVTMAQENKVTMLQASLPVDCALAVSRAMQDLEKWYASQARKSEGFNEYYVRAFGKVDCVEHSGGIRIYMFPRESGMRGGGISYLVSRPKFVVVERTFDR